jgi:hypothetical protein
VVLGEILLLRVPDTDELDVALGRLLMPFSRPR